MAAPIASGIYKPFNRRYVAVMQGFLGLAFFRSERAWFPVAAEHPGKPVFWRSACGHVNMTVVLEKIP